MQYLILQSYRNSCFPHPTPSKKQVYRRFMNPSKKVISSPPICQSIQSSAVQFFSCTFTLFISFLCTVHKLYIYSVCIIPLYSTLVVHLPCLFHSSVQYISCTFTLFVSFLCTVHQSYIYPVYFIPLYSTLVVHLPCLFYSSVQNISCTFTLFVLQRGRWR